MKNSRNWIHERENEWLERRKGILKNIKSVRFTTGFGAMTKSMEKRNTQNYREGEREKERERSFRVENDKIEASRAGRGQDPRRWARGVLQPSTLLNFEIGCLLWLLWILSFCWTKAFNPPTTHPSSNPRIGNHKSLDEGERKRRLMLLRMNELGKLTISHLRLMHQERKRSCLQSRLQSRRPTCYFFS